MPFNDRQPCQKRYLYHNTVLVLWGKSVNQCPIFFFIAPSLWSFGRRKETT